MKRLLVLIVLMSACGMEMDDYFFTTRHGIEVHPSLETDFLRARDVEEWTEDLIYFWRDVLEVHRQDIISNISNSKVYIIDLDYLEYRGKEYNAVTWDFRQYIIEIAALCDCDIYNRVKSLFIHEESHIVVKELMPHIPYTNEAHHQFFKDVGLGY
jgi:hypothetical protein